MWCGMHQSMALLSAAPIPIYKNFAFFCCYFDYLRGFLSQRAIYLLLLIHGKLEIQNCNLEIGGKLYFYQLRQKRRRIRNQDELLCFESVFLAQSRRKSFDKAHQPKAFRQQKPLNRQTSSNVFTYLTSRRQLRHDIVVTSV